MPLSISACRSLSSARTRPAVPRSRVETNDASSIFRMGNLVSNRKEMTQRFLHGNCEVLLYSTGGRTAKEFEPPHNRRVGAGRSKWASGAGRASAASLDDSGEQFRARGAEPFDY